MREPGVLARCPARPCAEMFQGKLRVFFEKGADAEFGGEALGELVVAAQGDLGMVEALLGHEEDVGEVEEDAHAVVLAAVEFGAKGGPDDFGCGGEVAGEVDGQLPRDMAAARHEFQSLKAVEGIAEKRLGLKAGMDR